jgi:phage shock protein C
MTTYDTYAPRRFYRSSDRAVLGGVCAGIADAFGFNLRVLRLLTVIAFFLAMPLTVIVYLAIVFLFPARSFNSHESVRADRAPPRQCRKERRAGRKHARRQAKQRSSVAAAEAAELVRSKCQSLEQRLASLEKYITSSRYQLDCEFRRL